MVMTLGTRGNDGHSLVRDTKQFKERMDEIDFSTREKRKPARVKGGKKTFTYGK